MIDAPSLREQLVSVPEEPGVYLWKNTRGDVLYVGKAKQLRTRMRQYVTGHDEREKIPLMMERVATYEYIVTENETESLILEKNLIQQFSPPYNVDFRDDKSYPFIALTMSDPFPAIKFTRERHREGTRYFGPYTDSRAARDTIDILRRIVPICSAQCVEWKKLTAKGGAPTGKPCFDYHVGRGPGPCVGACTVDEYAENVNKVVRFLKGRYGDFTEELRDQMLDAAADLDFERAARFRTRLETLESLHQKQHVVFGNRVDLDIVGFFREETIAAVHVFVVREGRVLVGNEFVLDKGLDVSTDELIETFLVRYYDTVTDLPKEIVVPEGLVAPEVVESWLSSKRGSNVKLTVPRRGAKTEMLEMAERNARHTLMRFKVRTRYDEERINSALLQLESSLALPGAPMRIEAVDVSTLHGSYSVASLVTFANGRPDTAGYRRFRVRLETEDADDFAMMEEVLSRRFSPERMEDERFGREPDLLIVDGGKPQLNVAVRVLESLGLERIPVIGIAKRDEEIHTTWSDVPILLPDGSPSLYLVKAIRDEAHRFAITYHRQLRDRGMTASVLDDIPGVGPTRKKALLKAFRGIRKLREATVDEIAAVKGIPLEVAREVRLVLDQMAGSED